MEFSDTAMDLPDMINPLDLEVIPSEVIEVEMPNYYPVMSEDFLNANPLDLIE